MIAVYAERDFVLSLAGVDDWGIAWPWLERAMPYMQGRLTQGAMRERLRDGVSQLWLVHTAIDGDELAACFTSRVGDGFMIELIGADNLGIYLSSGLTAVEHYMATTYGCKWSQLVGRMGWGKKLRALGYSPQVLMCEKRFI